MSNYKQLSATNQVKVGAGKLRGIYVSSTTGGTLTIYDEAQGGTTKIIANTITPAAGSTNLVTPDGIWFGNGLYIVAANTIEYTVVYD
jgi:hypothetical protein